MCCLGITGNDPRDTLASMTDQRPTDDLRGTEPARQTRDPALSERDSDNPVGPTSPLQDSRPGIWVAVAFLVLFVVVLIGAVVAGVIG